MCQIVQLKAPLPWRKWWMRSGPSNCLPTGGEITFEIFLGQLLRKPNSHYPRGVTSIFPCIPFKKEEKSQKKTSAARGSLNDHWGGGGSSFDFSKNWMAGVRNGWTPHPLPGGGGQDRKQFGWRNSTNRKKYHILGPRALFSTKKYVKIHLR